MTDQPEYTGGSVSYYTCSVTHPINEQADPYDAECIDIIDALQMTPNEANAFKALWRRAAARLGKSKRGYTDGLYDAEKVEFYGKRLVELERRARPASERQLDEIAKGTFQFYDSELTVLGTDPGDPFGPRDADGWYAWSGHDTMRPAGKVDVIDKEGECSVGPLDAGALRWNHNGSAGDIVKWRPVANR